LKGQPKAERDIVMSKSKSVKNDMDCADHIELYHDIEWWKQNRKEQYDFVQNQIIPAFLKRRIISVIAPPKSGKKDLEIILTLLTKKDPDHRFINVHFTSMMRRDVKNQYAQLNAYEMEVIQNPQQLVAKMKDIGNPGNVTIILHYDESDFGTGQKQRFDNAFRYIKKYRFNKDGTINPKIAPGFVMIGYSATPYDLNHSNMNPVILGFQPGQSYCGIHFYLDNDLVRVVSGPMINLENVESGHYDLCITPSGHEIMEDFMKSDKPLLIYRQNDRYALFLSRLKKIKEAMRKKYHRLLDIVVVDQNNSIDLSTSEQKLREGYYKRGVQNWRDFINRGLNKDGENKEDSERSKTIIVVHQTCTRSTELAFHKYLFALYDYRNQEEETEDKRITLQTRTTKKGVVIEAPDKNKLVRRKFNANTLIQAYGRVFAYNLTFETAPILCVGVRGMELLQHYAQDTLKSMDSEYYNLSSRAKLASGKHSQHGYSMFYLFLKKEFEYPNFADFVKAHNSPMDLWNLVLNQIQNTPPDEVWKERFPTMRKCELSNEEKSRIVIAELQRCLRLNDPALKTSAGIIDDFGYGENPTPKSKRKKSDFRMCNPTDCTENVLRSVYYGQQHNTGYEGQIISFVNLDYVTRFSNKKAAPKQMTEEKEHFRNKMLEETDGRMVVVRVCFENKSSAHVDIVSSTYDINNAGDQP